MKSQHTSWQGDGDHRYGSVDVEQSQIGLLSGAIQQAADPFAACEAIADHLVMDDHFLLFLGAYDIHGVQPARLIFSKLPAAIHDLCGTFDAAKGCPLIANARQKGEVVDALTSTEWDIHSLRQRSYQKELNKLGFDSISVVPVETSKTFFVMFIGSHSNSSHLWSTIGGSEFAWSLIELLSARFGFIDNFFSPANLSKVELQILKRLAHGKAVSHLAEEMRLDSTNLEEQLNAIKRKLGARNTMQAVCMVSKYFDL